jgi:hypothetical protein
MTGVEIQHNFAKDTIEIRRVVDGVPMVASIPRNLASNELILPEAAIKDGLYKVGLNEYEVMQLTQSVLRPSTAPNNINSLYGVASRYGVGYCDPRNAYKPPPRFPRSQEELDRIMMRRVNARLQLQQEKALRHWKHVAIAAGVIVMAPLVVAAILRMWGFALAWIAT